MEWVLQFPRPPVFHFGRHILPPITNTCPFLSSRNALADKITCPQGSAVFGDERIGNDSFVSHGFRNPATSPIEKGTGIGRPIGAQAGDLAYFSVIQFSGHRTAAYRAGDHSFANKRTNAEFASLWGTMMPMMKSDKFAGLSVCNRLKLQRRIDHELINVNHLL